MRVSEIRGNLVWGPYNKDPTIWGTMLESPIFGNPQSGVSENRGTSFWGAYNKGPTI